ncbi:MAG TPA: aryl-sulfate sulfotransferase [Thermoleophilaceae bacterium]|nr:aryl-sulfate sulfotransferase [Thermoleophilaceae bacterium]
MRRLLVATAVAAALGAPAGAAASVEIEADPGLHPHFSRAVSDYVARCPRSGTLVLSVRATGGDRVAVGDREAKGGEFVETVERRPGEAVTVRVESSSGSGAHHVRCLPRDFPRWDSSRPLPPQAHGYVVTPNGRDTKGYVAILDPRGTPVWWRRSSSYGPWDAKILPGDHIAWTHYKGGPFGQLEAYGYEERRLSGRRVRRIRTDATPTDTHDLQRLPNGHYLALTYVARDGVDLRRYGGDRESRVYDGELQELTPGGRVVWRWSSRGRIRTSETLWWDVLNGAQRHKEPDERFWDLVHINSVEPAGGDLIVSFRHVEAIYKIDRATGRILWKLGGTRRPESLDVVGDPLGDSPFGGQHDVRLWKDGTLTVFDNQSGNDRAPRAVRYRIDERARTATLLEQIHPPRSLESGFAGSARKLDGGDWVVYWGGTPLFTEQRPGSGRQVLALTLHRGHWGYRVVPLPESISIGSLRRAMDRLVAGARRASWR